MSIKPSLFMSPTAPIVSHCGTDVVRACRRPDVNVGPSLRSRVPEVERGSNRAHSSQSEDIPLLGGDRNDQIS